VCLTVGWPSGSLLAPEVLQALLGRLPRTTPAMLPGYRRATIASRSYPGAVEAGDGMVAGLLVLDLSASGALSFPGAVWAFLRRPGAGLQRLTPGRLRAELRLLDAFEGEEYVRLGPCMLHSHSAPCRCV